MASQLVTRESTAESIVAGSDVDRHVQQLQDYVDAQFGKDPRYVYSSSRMGGAAGYNQTGFDWQVVVYDRAGFHRYHVSEHHATR